MIKELPDYIFNKNYDNFYLLTEYDIIFNEKFTKNLNIFCKRLNSEKLLIKLEVPLEYNSLVPNRIELTDSSNLSNFYEMSANVNEAGLMYYMLNFFINDSSELWEIYVSLENELSVIGCSKEISSLFEVLFNPYKDESVQLKYKIIGDMFDDEELKILFIESLERNYKFSETR
ncbi:hypothetical protein [Flavobacterium pectinovorum]|uniref:Uncharacterized protein n=1 Tax=Flavobacterium pectinovorum TaxID=29533 RepID=A0A502EMH4_9FLAO|nr:hypothetical protein [Flavobacterium pectinovorum]TPG38202.1 hypothetical protein EAH81_17390 [Flavobacterium pectinovorum]